MKFYDYFWIAVLFSCCSFYDTDPCACRKSIYVKSNAYSIKIKKHSYSCGDGRGHITKMDTNLFKIDCPVISSNECPSRIIFHFENKPTDSIYIDSITYDIDQCRSYKFFFYHTRTSSYENDTITFI